MVRPPAAGAHAPRHARQTTCRHPAGATGAADALSVPLASVGERRSDERREGESGLADVLRQLEGHAAPAAAWEDDLLAARVQDYEPAMLDKLCAVGRVVWWRPSDGGDAQKRPDPRHADRARRTRRVAALAAGRRRGEPCRGSDAVQQGARGARGAAHARRQFLRRPATRRRLARRAHRAGAGRAGGAGAGHVRQLCRLARAGDAGRQAQQDPAPRPRPTRSTMLAAGR